MQEVSLKFEFSEDEEGLPLMGLDALLDQIEEQEQIAIGRSTKHDETTSRAQKNKIDEPVLRQTKQATRTRMQPTEFIRCQNNLC